MTVEGKDDAVIVTRIKEISTRATVRDDALGLLPCGEHLAQVTFINRLVPLRLEVVGFVLGLSAEALADVLSCMLT